MGISYFLILVSLTSLSTTSILLPALFSPPLPYLSLMQVPISQPANLAPYHLYSKLSTFWHCQSVTQETGFEYRNYQYNWGVSLSQGYDPGSCGYLNRASLYFRRGSDQHRWLFQKGKILNFLGHGYCEGHASAWKTGLRAFRLSKSDLHAVFSYFQSVNLYNDHFCPLQSRQQRLLPMLHRNLTHFLQPN